MYFRHVGKIFPKKLSADIYRRLCGAALFYGNRAENSAPTLTMCTKAFLKHYAESTGQPHISRATFYRRLGALAKHDLLQITSKYVPGHRGSKHTCITCWLPEQFWDTSTTELLVNTTGEISRYMPIWYPNSTTPPVVWGFQTPKVPHTWNDGADKILEKLRQNNSEMPAKQPKFKMHVRRSATKPEDREIKDGGLIIMGNNQIYHPLSQKSGFEFPMPKNPKRFDGAKTPKEIIARAQAHKPIRVKRKKEEPGRNSAKAFWTWYRATVQAQHPHEGLGGFPAAKELHVFFTKPLFGVQKGQRLSPTQWDELYFVVGGMIEHWEWLKEIFNIQRADKFPFPRLAFLKNWWQPMKEALQGRAENPNWKPKRYGRNKPSNVKRDYENSAVKKF